MSNKIENVKDIPIYIISFNRLSYLKEMIAFLEKYNLKNIHIIDNLSSYQPLLDYLKKSKYTVHYMSKNYGHKVFFDAPEFKDVRENKYFVLTDPDVIPVDECPSDFMEIFYDALQKHKFANKVGFSLKIDDIPDAYELKAAVLDYEKTLTFNQIGPKTSKLFKAYIDTTFALYRPQLQWEGGDGKGFFSAIRTAFPYEARHLPWYKSLKDLNEEDIFYNSMDCGSGTWNGNKKANEIITKRIYCYKLLGFLPLLKVKLSNKDIRVWLFGFIPFLLIKQRLSRR